MVFWGGVRRQPGLGGGTRWGEGRVDRGGWRCWRGGRPWCEGRAKRGVQTSVRVVAAAAAAAGVSSKMRWRCWWDHGVAGQHRLCRGNDTGGRVGAPAACYETRAGVLSASPAARGVPRGARGGRHGQPPAARSRGRRFQCQNPTPSREQPRCATLPTLTHIHTHERAYNTCTATDSTNPRQKHVSQPRLLCWPLPPTNPPHTSQPPAPPPPQINPRVSISPSPPPPAPPPS